MSQDQIELITLDALLEKVRAKKAQDCRLVQISATQLPGSIELTYSFDLNSQLTNLRLSLPGEAPHLPSISSIYLCAILYENEIHDLFGVQVAGMAIDFKGNFYKTAIKYPFATSAKIPCASSAAAPAAGAASCATTPPATKEVKTT
jgi:ech hydrogenase subunit D